MWLGYGTNVSLIFRVADGYKYNEKVTKKIDDGFHYGIVPAITWYTNLDIDKRHEPLILTKNYNGNEDKYPNIVNYPSIEVSKVDIIPKDYYEIMAVPITYLAVHCSDQFEILGSSGLDAKPMKGYAQKEDYTQGGPSFYVLTSDGDYNDKKKYHRLYNRIIIRRKDKPTNSSAGGQN